MSPINPPPPTSFAQLSFPAPGVVLVTYNRPEKLNCTRAADVVELTRIFQWIDEEPTLSVAIITGAGDRAFSTGADLTEWQSKISGPGAQAQPGAGPGDVPGAIPLSNRVGKKPVIAAVNGLALGGGCETIVNCDIVVAADTATVSQRWLSNPIQSLLLLNALRVGSQVCLPTPLPLPFSLVSQTQDSALPPQLTTFLPTPCLCPQTSTTCKNITASRSRTNCALPSTAPYENPNPHSQTKSQFGLVEVKRGVAPYAGVLPRLIRTLGLQRASELALTGTTFTATQAHTWGLVNKVVPRQTLLDEAVRYATLIAENSPDSIICTRAGLRQGWETASVVEATRITGQKEWADLQRGENIVEGLRAFKERRKPNWVPSKL